MSFPQQFGDPNRGGRPIKRRNWSVRKEAGVCSDVERAAASEFIEVIDIGEVSTEKPVAEKLEKDELEFFGNSPDVGALPAQYGRFRHELWIECIEIELRMLEFLELLLPGIAPNSGAMLSDNRETSGDLMGNLGPNILLSSLVDRGITKPGILKQASGATI